MGASMLLGCLALLALGVALIAAPPADAAFIHKPAGTFELPPTTAAVPGPIAVDEETGSVYVARASFPGTGNIEKFDAEGNPSNFSALGTNAIDPPWAGNSGNQIAVDNSGGPNQGVIYIASLANLTVCCNPSGPNPLGGVHVYLPSGQKLFPQLEGQPGPGGIFTRSQEESTTVPCGVAVDANGDLIVAHGSPSTEFSYIDKLSIEPWATHPEQEPELLGTINSDSSSPCKTQLDSTGAVYSQTGEDFSSSGAVRKRTIEFHEPSGIGPIPLDQRDPSTLAHAGPDAGFALDAEDNLYGARPSGPGRIEKVDQRGSLIETFGSGELLQPRDIAVNKSTGTVYVTDGSTSAAEKDVHIFKAFTVPNSLTGAFVASAQTSGTLNGEVDLAEAGEEVTGCEFEYVSETLFKTGEFGSATAVPCEQGTTFTANEAVSADLSGLTMEESYLYRLKTENANGASNGTIRKFAPHAVIDLSTKPATNVAPKSATLNASFAGNGDATEYYFEYGNGLSGVYTVKTATQSAGSPAGPMQLSLPLSELELESTYHYRVVAVNSTGTSKGFEQSFTTPPAVAGLTTKPASAIGQETVTLNGSFTGDGHDTHYFFEYGPTSSYGQVSEEAPGSAAGTTTGTTDVSTEITDYYGYTTYHYRVVASNEFGETHGKDMTFSTEPAPRPGITGTSVSNITPTSATFSAQVAPNRWDASWLFEWGSTTAYGSQTELEDVLIGLDPDFAPVSTTVSGLEPASVYHYRTVAFNFTGASTGPDQTFVTPDLPKVASTAVSAVTQTSAHLSARVIANSSPTTVHFEFGPGVPYGASTPPAAIGSDTFARESSYGLAGLSPGTTYHYRVVGVNGFGTTTGPDQTFTTEAAVAPPPATKPRPRRCRKGKVRRKGKCVRKHKRHKKHRKRHHRNGKRHG